MSPIVLLAAVVLVGWAVIIVPIRFLRKRRREQGDVQVLRGSALVDVPRDTSGRTRSTGDRAAPLEIHIGGVAIQAADEAEHILFSGATGSGKTQGISQVLKTIRARKARAVIADAAGGALEKFYESGDVIVNPFDKRSVDWSPFAEIRTDYDCSRLAKAAIPDAEGDSREWHVYAQTLLGETLRAMHGLNNHSVKSLVHYLMAADAKALSQLLEGTAAEMLCSEGSDKMLANTRAIVSSYLVAWQYLPDQGQFSVRTWVHENDGHWLFVTYREDQFDMLRYLVAMMLDLAVVENLGLPEDDSRQLWFIMDEVDSLGKISSLRNGLTKLRKYGGRCVLGLQTISQLRSTYGSEEAQTLMANVATKIVLRAGDGETAEYFSREFGSQEIERTQISRSRTLQAGFGTSKTSSKVRETRRTVLESEIAGLANLDGYLKTPGSLVKIHLAYEKRDKRAEAFIG